jgi:hypothetical protein
MEESYPNVSEIINNLSECKAKILSLSSKSIKGIVKLINRITSEINHFQKIKDNMIKWDGVSGNYYSCMSITNIVCKVPEITHILHKFDNKSDKKDSIYDTLSTNLGLCVDVIAFKGHVWIKNFSMSTQNIKKNWEYNCKENVYLTAIKFNNYRNHYTYHFLPPLIVFWFNFDLPINIADKLRHMGIIVIGNIIEDVVDNNFIDYYETELDSECYKDNVDNVENLDNSDAYVGPVGDSKLIFPKIINPNHYCAVCEVCDCLVRNYFNSISMIKNHSDEINKKCECDEIEFIVNIDLTTLVALVSEISNTDCDKFYSDDSFIKERMLKEKNNHTLEKINNFLKGNKVVMCQSALDHCQIFRDKMAGPKERQRIDELLRTIIIVPDSTIDFGCGRAHVHDVTYIIFATSYENKFITSSSNDKIVNVLEELDMPIFIHPPMSMGELKMFPFIKN